MTLLHDRLPLRHFVPLHLIPLAVTVGVTLVVLGLRVSPAEMAVEPADDVQRTGSSLLVSVVTNRTAATRNPLPIRNPRVGNGAIGGPLQAGHGVSRKPLASFDPIDDSGPGIGADYYKHHYAEDSGQIDLTLRLDVPAPATGADVFYDIVGDAQLGLHYVLLAGSQSPIHFQPGQTVETISIQTLQGAHFFDEVLLGLQLDAASSQAYTEASTDELRIYLRSLTPPPSLEFASATSSAGAGVQSIPVQLVVGTSKTRELIHVYWRQSNAGSGNAAVLGVDYDWLPGSESGTLTIDTSTGQSSVNIPFQVLPGAVDGRVLQLTLDHELSDRSDENKVTFTHDLRMEVSTKGQEIWPGDPADYMPGPANLLADGPVPLTQFIDVGSPHPDTGESLGGLMLAEGATGSGYHRKSFENEVECGGPQQLIPLRRFTRYGIHVALPSAGAPTTGFSRFIRMNVRDRNADANHVVVFDRESPDGGLLGAPVSTASGDWGVWATVTWNATSEFGVDVGEDGRTRLWILYHEEDPAMMGHVTARIMYPVWFGGDGTASEVGGASANIGKGLLFYDPTVETSNKFLTGPPGRFWEKRRNWWEPRGRSVIDPLGRYLHEFTIDVP